MGTIKKLKKLTAALTSVCIAAMGLPFYAAESHAEDAVELDMPDFSFIGAVGELSAEESARVAEATYNALANHEPEVHYGDYGLDLTDDNKSDFLSVYYYVRNCCDVGILAASGTVYSSTYSDALTLSYLFDDSEYAEQFVKYSAMLDEILSGVKPGWSDEEKALYVHDYLAVKYDYDYPA